MQKKHYFLVLISLFYCSLVIASSKHMDHDGGNDNQMETSANLIQKSDMDVTTLYAEMEANLQEMDRLAGEMTNTTETNKRKNLFEQHRSKMQKTMLLMHKLMAHDNAMHMR